MTSLTQTMTKEQQATLFAVVITNFVNPFAVTALNIAVPHIGAEFHIVATQLTWIVLSFTLTNVVLTIPFGRISDIVGRESIFRTGIVLVGIASVGIMFAPNVTIFMILRVLQGVGGAMVFATNISLLVAAFPANKRGGMLGIAVAAVYSGSACGPVVGGVLTHHYGWRSVFLFIALLSAVAFIVVLLRLPKKTVSANTVKIRKSSIVLYMAAVGFFAYGLTTLMQNIWSYVILAAGILFTVIFVRHELRVDNPIVDLRLIKNNSRFTFSNIAALFNYATTIAIAYLISIYLQLVKGLDADVSGLILICQPVLQVVISPIAGRLSDKRSPYVLSSLGMACCAASLFMFAFVDEATTFAYILAALSLVGIGFGLFSSPNSNIIMSSVSRQEYNMASSVQSTARTLGQVIGMAAITIITNSVIGNKAIQFASKGELVLDMHISFTIFACICVVGIFFSSKRNPKSKL